MTTGAQLFGSAPWLRAMGSIASRGPDASACLCTGIGSSNAFGHTRLAIIGLGDPGAQPYGDDDRGVLVFNGEIYNYLEIAQRLGIRGDSDTHVLFELLAQRRTDLMAAIRGMYAFVFWDAPTGQLVAARDPFGIKPLFRLDHPNGEISFASTVAALAQHPDAGGPDAVALSHFLATGYMPEGVSAFGRISKVAPGKVHVWHRGQRGFEAQSPRNVRLEGWEKLPPAEAIEDSVQAHLVADVEIGVMLSGGVDSTLITAIASQYTDELRTYSLTNPLDPRIDEGSLAAWNASLLGTRHTEVVATPDLLNQQLDPLIRSTGEPFSDAAYLPLSLLSKRISADVKVVLAGEGADELFGGYRRYDVERLALRPAIGPAIRWAARLTNPLTHGRLPRESQVARSIASWRLRPSYASHGELMFFDWDVVLQAFPEVGGGAVDLARRDWARCSRSDWALDLASNRAFDLRSWLPNVHLEKSDRASMLHGLEVRTPFLDPAVATSTLDLEVRDTAKRPLRESLLRRVPEVRLPARKKGLSVGLEGLMEAGPGRLADELLRDPGSLLVAMGLHDPRGALAARARESAVFRFRLATMAAWDRVWGTGA